MTPIPSCGRARGLVVASILAVVGIGVVPDPAQADAGVGITASPITSASALVPGTSETLGPVTVVNTGSAEASIDIWVEAGDPAGDAADRRPVPPSWVDLDTDSVALEADEQAAIPLTVTVPADAEPGRYRSLIFAGVAMAIEPGASGVNGIGARTATWLEFTVDPLPPVDPPGPGGRPALVLVGIVGLAAGLGGGLALARRHRHAGPSRSF